MHQMLKVALAALLMGVMGAAHAQNRDYPSRTIRFVVPFPPGGATDVVTRIVAQKLNDRHKRQVAIVDNRAGAGGVIGSEVVARAAPDGYTLVMGTTGTHAINASLYAKPSYHPIRDFAPVTPAALLPNMLVAHPSIPVKNVRDLIALAKARPGDLSYASSGNFLYLSGALFTSMAKVQMLHVPFKGGAIAMPAVVSGEVGLSFATIVSSLPLVQTGKLRGLAVTSARRFPSAPAYPTVAESGLPGYEAVAWYGVFAPAGTPPEIIEQLNGDIVSVINAPDVKALLLKQGAEAYATSSGEFAGVVQRDVEKWRKVVRESGAKAG